MPECFSFALDFLSLGVHTALQMEHGHMRHPSLFSDFVKDLVYAARKLKNAPTFATTLVLTIALGIGASTAIFSVVNTVLLRPLPYGSPDQLVLSEDPVSNADFFDLRDGTRAVFDDLAAVMVFRTVVSREDGSAERISKGQVTTNFFHLLGAHIIYGRDFTEADGIPESPVPPPFPPPEGSVAILSYDYFQRRYGADPSVIGRTLPGTNGIGPQIVGVLQPGFKMFLPASVTSQPSADVWISNNRGYDQENRGGLMLHLIGRLKPNVTLEQAQSQIDRVATTWGADRIQVHFDFWHNMLVKDVRPALIALMAAVILLFLVACSNTANLVLVRTSIRERELAIRSALGAGIGRITRQMLTEAALIGCAGTVLAVALAWLGIRVLLRIAPSNLPRLDSTSIDWRVLLFSASCGILGSIILGLLPTLSVVRSDVIKVLHSAGRSGHLGSTGILRSGAVIAEVAFAFALLIGSGLMFRSFVELLHVRPGYDPHGLLTFLTIGNAKDVAPERRLAFLRDLQERLRSIPGIESVGGATALPLHWVGPPDGVAWSADRIPADPSHRADIETVLPGYFEALRSRVLEGRTFTDADNTSGRNVAVIDRSLAAKIFPNQSALERRICVYIPDPTWLRVIGVVDHQRLHSLADPGREQIFITDGFWGVGISRHWALRTKGDPRNYVALVRSQIAEFAPGRLAITDMQTMDTTIDREQSGPRFDLLLIGIFAVIAALLAAVGLYGVVSSTVRQRTAEIGLRIAFGAEPARVVRLVIAQGLILGVVGIAIGLIGSLGLTRIMISMLIGIRPTDPSTYVVITLLFFLVTAVACWVPARRAGGIDPMAALREE
ncbi:MAG TPA: ABC transporter permease [Terriglobales bacterium]|nr:ABC transporter permease [Terriglobales bacterium]